ncbi:MAG: hypothetical protein ACK53W_00530 [Gemmatimonadota bacterium]
MCDDADRNAGQGEDAAEQFHRQRPINPNNILHLNHAGIIAAVGAVSRQREARGATVPASMAGRTNEQRERAIVELFADLHPQGLRVVEHRDKPDAIVQTSVGEVVGVEVTELLLPDDGRDRSLEGIARAGIEQACRELPGPSGDIDVRMPARPADRAQVQRWLAAFRAWLAENRAAVIEQGREFPAETPAWARTRLAAMQAVEASDADVEACRAELAAAMDLDWLHVSIVTGQGSGAWCSLAEQDGQRLADRHRHDVDEVAVQAVASKIAKASDYDFGRPLWLLLRSFVHAPVTDAVGPRIAVLPGIERIAEVWLLDVPANTIDAARPPTAHRLHPVAT